MCNDVKFDINLKLTKFALKWVLTSRDSFIFKYCNHGKYVKFHFKMKRLHPRAGPSSRHMAPGIMSNGVKRPGIILYYTMVPLL